MTANLAIYSVQILLVVLAAAVAARLVPRGAIGLRLAYYRGVIVTCLMLPLGAPWLPPAAGRFGVAIAGAVEDEAMPLAAGAMDLRSLAALAPAIVLAGIAIRLSWLAAGMWRLRRLRQGGTPLEPGTRAALLRDEIAPAAGLWTHPRVRQPLTFGWRRPVVLVPDTFTAWSVDTQEAVICHELIHVARRDWGWTIAEELVRSAFWFHPAVRWTLSQIELAREQAVDRSVVARTAAPATYMRALLSFAGGTAHAPSMAGGRRGHLAARIRQLSRATVASKRRVVVAAAVAVIAVGAAAWSITSLLPFVARPATNAGNGNAPPPPEDVLRIGGAVSPPRVVNEVRPVYSPEALQAKIQGNVLMEVVVDTDGSVVDAKVITSLDPGLDRNALEAARQWRFEPATSGGKPVKVAVTLEMTFTLA